MTTAFAGVFLLGSAVACGPMHGAATVVKSDSVVPVTASASSASQPASEIGPVQTCAKFARLMAVPLPSPPGPSTKAGAVASLHSTADQLTALASGAGDMKLSSDIRGLASDWNQMASVIQNLTPAQLQSKTPPQAFTDALDPMVHDGPAVESDCENDGYSGPWGASALNSGGGS